MSFGSLSENAILALNGGAKLDNFAHNTGEGGLSDYHLQPGGDIIWQIGTGYFSCRHKDGTIDYDAFAERAVLPQVKMMRSSCRKELSRATGVFCLLPRLHPKLPGSVW
jgi:glutamate synthase domain-containing protein 2